MTEDDILNEYASLVRHIARSACYSSTAIDFADLCQVGEMAVLRAIKSYDPSCGSNIRSFITRLVRQDIYNEAARFLGVFTVDRRVTSLASKVNKLCNSGKTDEEIASILSGSGERNFDALHVRDLRIAYSRRQQVAIESEELTDNNFADENTIKDLLDSVVKNNAERVILENRILKDATVADVSHLLNINQSRVYSIESSLKKRIKRAIKDITQDE